MKSNREISSPSDSGVSISRIEATLTGMDNHLFVSRCQSELPKKEETELFLAAHLKEIGDGE